MTIIPDEKALEDLLILNNIPKFSATITSAIWSLSPPLVSFLNFKYDNSKIIGNFTLPNNYALELMADYGAKDLSDLNMHNIKIDVYTPSIESGKIYAIKSVKPVSYFDSLSEEHKVVYANLVRMANDLKRSKS